MATQDSFGVPPIPMHLADFPTVGGLVVPYITLRHRNGTAALGLVDYSRMVHCFQDRRCGVCGEVVGERMVFFMRSVDLDRGLSSEPGLCPPCAAYTMAACPMIAGHMAHYRRSQPAFIRRRCDDPECECSQWVSQSELNRYGAAREQWFTLWTTQYRLTRDEKGRLAAGFAGLRVLTIREIKQQPAEDAGQAGPRDSREYIVNENQQFPADIQFTVAELLTIVETFEVAMQTKGSIDTTSSGGASPEEEAEILTDMGYVLAKARELHSQALSANRTEQLWSVWPVDEDGNEIASVNEFSAASAAGALAQTTDMAVVGCADFAGWKVIQVRTQMDAADEVEAGA